ncbi:RICIN domain-containing protein [Actinokineospora xionganensis]|uniref:Ricin-type beta-trefoil lectin domain protein n=1 Tax=Actinokineospora xionganensis TaxID=2684470 RepID=A0ABR7L0F0_9PSEU|nr:RICIN domain-containing protein [Actinokineospora xionganensis]MBC6446177.1 ricin-type beta-trefoil lectin domain protein [Actinokineospora xionganensis]
MEFSDLIDPRSATDLVEFVALLNALRGRAGNPGYGRLEAMARDTVGPGVLSKATVHRVLSGTYDLSRLQQPEKFVVALVTTLGEDPGPWLATFERLLKRAHHPMAPDPESVAAEGPGRSLVDRFRRLGRGGKLLVGAGAAALVASIVAASVLAGAPASPLSVDYDRAVAIGPASGALRVALDENTTRLGAPAMVLEAAPGEVATWSVTAPFRANRNFHQLRQVDGGRELICLEVRDKSLADDAVVQFAGCNGEPHQYWRLLPTGHGTLRITNLHSGKCMSVAGAGEPQSGMHVIQRLCDDGLPAQQWMTRPVSEPVASNPVPVASALDPAELPRGGKDQPCAGMPMLEVDKTAWVSEKFSVRQEWAHRGHAAIRPSAGGVELFRANIRDPRTQAEVTYYWAEGFVKFTPSQFTLYLQWTTVRGPGGWHTCAVAFPDQGSAKSPALPRDSAPGRFRDVQFRICVSYQPRQGDAILECSADRY